MKELHKATESWDTTLPQSFQERCSEWYESLEALASIALPRFVDVDNGVRIVGFADASGKAYGAAVYLQSVDGIGPKTQLFAASREHQKKRSPFQGLSC